MNCTIPALVKSSVGSFAGTSGLEGTRVCPFDSKYSMNLRRISLVRMDPWLRRAGLAGARRTNYKDTKEPRGLSRA